MILRFYFQSLALSGAFIVATPAPTAVHEHGPHAIVATDAMVWITVFFVDIVIFEIGITVDHIQKLDGCGNQAFQPVSIDSYEPRVAR